MIIATRIAQQQQRSARCVMRCVPILISLLTLETLIVGRGGSISMEAPSRAETEPLPSDEVSAGRRRLSGVCAHILRSDSARWAPPHPGQQAAAEIAAARCAAVASGSGGLLRLRPLRKNSPFGVAVESDSVDLSRPVEPRTMRRLAAAFAEHSVLVFRRQPLTDQQQLAFTRQLASALGTALEPVHVVGGLQESVRNASVHSPPTLRLQRSPMVCFVHELLLPCAGRVTCLVVVPVSAAACRRATWTRTRVS